MIKERRNKKTMNRLSTSSFSLALLLLLAVTGPIAWAQSKPASINIAVVDTQFLMANAAAAKSASAQIEQMRTSYQSEIKGKEDDLDKSAQALAKDKATLAPDAYTQRVNDLQEKAATLQQDAQDHETQFDNALNAASAQIAVAVVRAVDEIKKEKKIALVLARSAIVGTVGVPDITQDVLARVNQQMPAIVLVAPVPTATAK